MIADNPIWAAGRERNEQEALLDVGYAIALSDLHCRLFRRTKKVTSFLTVVCGGGAVASSIGGPAGSAVTATLAGFVTALAAYDLIFDPGAAAARHHLDKREFLRLATSGKYWKLARIDAELNRIREGATDCLKALEKPAYNENLRSHGLGEGAHPLTRWERFVYWLA